MDKTIPPLESLPLEDVARLFTKLGGRFILPPGELASKLLQIKTFIFDWDGVFNTGLKGNGINSSFSEPDSMGTNMLRYGLWLRNRQLPCTGIITGADNQAAIAFAKREHFHEVYIGVKDKRLAIEHLIESRRVDTDQIACVYDDINDLGMAERCGLRFAIQRSASPLFNHYVIRRKLCDYITGGSSQDTPVREISELSLGLMGVYDAVVDSRVNWDADYQEYFQQRQTVATRFYTQEGTKIIPLQTDP